MPEVRNSGKLQTITSSNDTRHTPMDHLFKSDRPDQYVCSTWFERDRAAIRLETPRGKVIFELWDDEVADAIESGYLTPPRHPSPTDQQWLESALDYARGMNLLPQGVESQMPGLPRFSGRQEQPAAMSPGQRLRGG